MERLIKPQWWFGRNPQKILLDCPFQGDFASLYPCLYTKFGSENISVENVIFVIAFRTIFENVEGL